MSVEREALSRLIYNCGWIVQEFKRGVTMYSFRTPKGECVYIIARKKGYGKYIDYDILHYITPDMEDHVRICDDCGHVTEDGEFPDWVDGVCEMCDPSILDHPDNKARAGGLHE